MYASFRSVTTKNGKTLTPTRTGDFLLTLMDPEFYATIPATIVTTVLNLFLCLNYNRKYNIKYSLVSHVSRSYAHKVHHDRKNGNL